MFEVGDHVRWNSEAGLVSGVITAVHTSDIAYHWLPRLGGRRHTPAGTPSPNDGEAVPWRCHRRLITDALLHDGLAVRHIMSAVSRPPPGRRRSSRSSDLAGYTSGVSA